MVVNAVTKLGHQRPLRPGPLRVPAGRPVVATARTRTSRTRSTESGLGASIGGPIVRDRLWYYGSASFPGETMTDRRNNLGAGAGPGPADRRVLRQAHRQPALAALPLRRAPLAGDHDRERRHHRQRPPERRQRRLDRLPARHLPLDLEHRRRTASSTLKLNHNKEENSTDPLTSLGYRPVFDAAHPELMGRFTTTADRIVGGATTLGQIVGGAELATNNQDFQRDEARVAFQTLQSWFGADARRARRRNLRRQLRAPGAPRQWLGHSHLERDHPAVHRQLRLPAAAAHRPRRGATASSSRTR